MLFDVRVYHICFCWCHHLSLYTGRAKAKEFMKANPDVANAVEAAIKFFNGVGLDAEEEEEEEEELPEDDFEEEVAKVDAETTEKEDTPKGW